MAIPGEPMSKSNTFESEILRHIFLNEAIPNIGDATGLPGSAAVGSVYMSLHTADPGEAGTAATNEIAYTGYARKALARNTTIFAESGGVLTLNVDVDFPKMTGGAGGTVTHFAFVKQLSGASTILYSGPLTNPTSILVAVGTTPRIEGTPSGTSSSVTED